VAPTSSPHRIEAICKQSSGYIYYRVSQRRDGASHLDVESVTSNLARLRQYTKLPLGRRLRIRDAESAAQIAKVADAVVVGSALINRSPN